MSVHMTYYKDGAKMMRPVLTREEYLGLRNGGEQKHLVAAIRSGNEGLKSKLLQMNYSCLPNEDGSLKGSKRMSTTVGMDIDHLSKEEMPVVRERILSKKAELGLLMLDGEQASGKSVCKHALDIWKRQFDEEDAIARAREEEWNQRKKSRKANEKAPDDPKVLIRVVPVTVSCSTLLKRMKYAKGHTLFSFGEELDTLRKTNGAGSWSPKYDMPTFTADDLAALKPGNAPRNSIIKIISRWNRDGWVMKADAKRWSKVKSEK